MAVYCPSYLTGLPARGKSYIVKMLIRYLSWTGISAKVFNVGEFRRKLVSGLYQFDGGSWWPSPC